MDFVRSAPGRKAIITSGFGAGCLSRVRPVLASPDRREFHGEIQNAHCLYHPVFAILVVMTLLTWVVPSGVYDYQENGEPVAGSYHLVDK